MASGKNGHLAENDAVDGESLRTLKAPRARTAGAEGGLGAEDPSFRVEFGSSDSSSKGGSSVGMMVALMVLLLAVCYLVFVLSRSETSPAPLANFSEESAPEKLAASMPAEETKPVDSSGSSLASENNQSVVALAAVQTGATQSEAADSTLSMPSVQDQLDPLDALLEYEQFGDSVRYLFRLERQYPNATSPLEREVKAVLTAWVESSKAPSVHDQEIIAILAARGFDEETMTTLVFRGADEMPEDAVWMGAAAERGHVDSMVRLASRLFLLNNDSPEAEQWYRRAAEKGNEEAIEWCERNSVSL